MGSRRNRTTQAARSSSDDALYLVLKVDKDKGELQELSSQVRPGSSDHLHFVTSRDSLYEDMATPSGTRRNTSRHPRPCGECSAAKTRCIPLSSNPTLCARCKSKKLPQCPPHVPWALRKARCEEPPSENPQAYTQGLTSSPVQITSPVLAQSVTMPYFPEPNPIQIGGQHHDAYGNDSSMYPAYSIIPMNSEESTQSHFHGIEAGAPETSFSQIDPRYYPSFEPQSGADQTYASTHIQDVHTQFTHYPGHPSW